MHDGHCNRTGMTVAGASSPSTLSSRLWALRPFTWSGRGGGLPYILTAGGAFALLFSIAALAGTVGGDLSIGWKIVWLVVGAYHTAVGGFTIREHLAKGDEVDQRFAWSNAGAYALCAPAFAAGAVLLIAHGLAPFPAKSAVITAPVDRFWADKVSSSHVAYRLRVQGVDRIFVYDCYDGRSGWCSDHDVLEAATARQALRAQVIVLNDEITELVIDGEELVNWDSERFGQRTLPLIFGALVALAALGFGAEFIGWTRHALTLRAADTPADSLSSPRIIE